MKKIAALAVSFAGFFALSGQPSAHATTVQEMTADMTNKMYYSALKDCVKAQTKNEVKTKEFNNWSGIFYTSAGERHLPDGWYGGDTISCGDVINRMIGSGVPTDEAERGLLLSSLGFIKNGDSTNASKRCVTVDFQRKVQDSNTDSSINDGSYSTPEVCFYLDDSNKVTSVNVDGALAAGNYPILINASQGYIEVQDMTAEGNYPISINTSGKTFDEAVAEYTAALASLSLRVVSADGSQPTFWYEIERNSRNAPDYHSTQQSEAEANAKGAYLRPADPMTVFNAIISKYSKVKDGVFTASERVSLYQFYLKNNAQSVCNPEDGWTPGSSFQKVRLVIKGEYYNDCYSSNVNGANSFAGFNNNGEFDYSVKNDFNKIISELNGTTASDKEGVIDPGATLGRVDGELADPNPVDPMTGETTGSDGSSSGGDATDVCYGAKGTLGMSWLLCPALTGLSNFLNGVYTWIQDDYLTVEPRMFSTSATIENGNGESVENQTYKAWQTFRDIANITFVILLLVVIFSQLTGIGIDNYGIKKILPRLVICAILINLSYFIAQFVIDISNILGKSLSGVFGSINVNEIGGYEHTDIPEKILGVSLTAGGAIAVASFVANPALLLSLLLTLVSGAISVLVMWAILVARKAGVVIAVVIAPLAFAAYLLPNTSRFTKSWINLMKSLLLLFPLAALLISACFFASNLIAAQNEGMILAAMLLRVVPFLALPSLFKKSLDAFGNLGAKIQGFGRGLTQSATGTMRNADWYKNAQERGRQRQTRVRAGLDQNGQEQTGWRGFLRSRNSRARARYRSQYLKDQGDQYKSELLNNQDYMDAMLRKQQFEADEAGRDATKYTEAGYIEGKEAQGRLSRENEVEGARLYTTPGFEGSKRSQYSESRQGELRKMFTEQNLSQGTTAEWRRDRLSELLRGGLAGQNDAAEAEALMDLLKDKGDIRQLIDGLNGISSAELGAMDAGLRGRITGRALAAGNTLLKGWAKSVNAGNSLNIDDYIRHSGAGGLSNYIANDAGAHAFDSADKDTLEFLVRHGGDVALSRDGAESALASMSTTAANSSARSSTAISQMLNRVSLRDAQQGTNVLGDIGSHVTAEDLSKMNNAVAGSYGAGALSNAINEINRPDNSDLRAKMSQSVKNTLGVVDPPTP